MMEWLRMGGYGFYVWGSYGVLALAVVIELVTLHRQRARALQYVTEAIEEERA